MVSKWQEITPQARILIGCEEAKNTKLCGGKTHRNREVPGGSKIEIRSLLPYLYISIIYRPKDCVNNAHLPRLFQVIQPSHHL